MAERNDISGLLAFISREGDWRDRLQDVVAEHLMPALEEFEIDHDGLADLLGEQWSGVLWGCGFEDFLGQHYEDGNIVDLYLKRRGWKETALNRAYFTALRDAPVSLYEVSDVQPGTSMVLRDLLSDAAPGHGAREIRHAHVEAMGPDRRAGGARTRSPCHLRRAVALPLRSGGFPVCRAARCPEAEEARRAAAYPRPASGLRTHLHLRLAVHRDRPRPHPGATAVHQFGRR
jgi:hypothetical protein